MSLNKFLESHYSVNIVHDASAKHGKDWTEIYAARIAWSIDICCPRPTSAANPPVADAAVDRRET